MAPPRAEGWAPDRRGVTGRDHGRACALADEVERFHATLAAFRDDLVDDLLTARIRDEQFLQAPLADAMTDVGQLAFLRRLYGAPIPCENFIFATVSADTLSPQQAMPNAPDRDWRPDEMPHPPGRGVTVGPPDQRGS